jgi:hypothetical protein
MTSYIEETKMIVRRTLNEIMEDNIHNLTMREFYSQHNDVISRTDPDLFESIITLLMNTFIEKPVSINLPFARYVYWNCFPEPTFERYNFCRNGRECKHMGKTLDDSHCHKLHSYIDLEFFWGIPKGSMKMSTYIVYVLRLIIKNMRCIEKEEARYCSSLLNMIEDFKDYRYEKYKEYFNGYLKVPLTCDINDEKNFRLRSLRTFLNDSLSIYSDNTNIVNIILDYLLSEWECESSMYISNDRCVPYERKNQLCMTFFWSEKYYNYAIDGCIVENKWDTYTKEKVEKILRKYKTLNEVKEMNKSDVVIFHIWKEKCIINLYTILSKSRLIGREGLWYHTNNEKELEMMNKYNLHFPFNDLVVIPTDKISMKDPIQTFSKYNFSGIPTEDIMNGSYDWNI